MQALIDPRTSRVLEIVQIGFPVAPPLTWVEAVEGVTTRHTYIDGQFVDPPSPPAPSVDDVAAERERRLAQGFDYDFGDERGVHRIATTDADMAGWDEVTKWAQAAINLGDASATINVLTETGPCTVTALEWQSILLAATAARQPLWAASFYLQSLDPIPGDYADDVHWPAQS